MALSNMRNYPVAEFKAFVQSTRRYIEVTADDPMIHKSVARAVNGLGEFLKIERKRVPGDILFVTCDDSLLQARTQLLFIYSGASG